MIEGEDYLHAGDLRQLLEQLNIEAFHLVGLSLGAFVALDYWALYPEKVRSFAVASAGIPDSRVEDTSTVDVDNSSGKGTRGCLSTTDRIITAFVSGSGA
ncbi:alpha/beta hydrolase [Paenibacillus sp. FSL M7-0896]|uniref:alpha/beta fold hydrolase n=1 Tax=Paenibacillus sp. FSL M7-0896 TaxID=2921610 RepID=UPI0030D97545